MHKIRFVLGFSLLLMASACGTSTPSAPTVFNPSPTASGTAVTIPSGAQTLGSNAFVPNPITVAKGSTVTWTNTDAIAHTVSSDTRIFDSGIVPAGATFNVMFQNTGTFPYHCNIHPGMVGTVVVQ